MKTLQLATLAILDHATDYEWSVHGFGLLRLYIRNLGRLHVWDSALRYPNVSMIHNHSWDLKSTVVSGQIINTRYTTEPPYEGYNTPGMVYHGKRLITGYNTRDVVSLDNCKLYRRSIDRLTAGDEYSQLAHEIHETNADDGTVSLMARKEDENGQADVYWPAWTEWGTAKPRVAEPAEVMAVVTRALVRLESEL